MGANQQKEALQYFKGVGTGEQEPAETEYAEHLQLYSEGLCSGSELGPLCRVCARAMVQKQIALGTTAPSRLAWMLRFCRIQWEACLKAESPASGTTLASLRVAELALRQTFPVVRGKSAALLELMEYPSSGAANAPRDNEGGKLCNILMHYLVKVPLTDKTVTSHAEVARFFLTSTSTALYHSAAFSEDSIDVFTEIIMSSNVLHPFLRVLLQRALAWGDAQEFGGPFYEYPAVSRGWLGWLGGGGGNGGGSDNKGKASARPGAYQQKCSHWEQVYRHSVDLLSVLVAHQKGNGKNPALEFIVSLKDSNEFSFKRFLSLAAAKMVTTPTLCMLLYVFFHDHPTFLAQTTTSSPALVVSAIVTVLNLTHIASTSEEQIKAGSAAGEREDAVLDEAALKGVLEDFTHFSYPFMNLMTGTLLLLLSQDAVVNKHVSDQQLAPTFLNLRNRSEKVSATCVMLMVLSTGITRALNERNEPLADMFVPCMANSAAFVHNIDTTTAQRIVSMLVLIVRKIRRTQQAFEVVSKKDDFPATERETSEQKKKSALACVEESGDMFVKQLGALVEAVETMLRGLLKRENIPLLYELLYVKQHLIDDITVPSSDDRFMRDTQKALAPLRSIIEYYDAAIVREGAHSFQEIVQLIEREGDRHPNSSSSGGGSGGAGASELVYSYEESPNSYVFFGPFLWSSLLLDASRPGGILFAANTQGLKLFPRP